jgi:hypothetical protein
MARSLSSREISANRISAYTPDMFTVVIFRVMGAPGTGKTTVIKYPTQQILILLYCYLDQFINLVSGASFQVGMGLHPCTSEVEKTLPFEFCGRSVTLIDTPGFNDTTQSDTVILQRISDYLAKQ